MSSPQDAIARIQYHARSLDGMREAPDYVPESANQFPFAISYYRTGNTIFEAGWLKGLHTIYSEIHVARQILPSAIRAAMPFYDSLLAALEGDPRLNNTVDTIISPVVHSFGRLEFGGQETIGWRFEITVKIQTQG